MDEQEMTTDETLMVRQAPDEVGMLRNHHDPEPGEPAFAEASRNRDASLTAGEVKNDVWESNHLMIAEAMSDFMRHNERMPTKTELAKITGLCRLTVYRHLKDYSSLPEVKQQKSEMQVLYTKLLARLYTFAMNGDVRAAKLYIDTVEKLCPTSNPSPRGGARDVAE